MKKIQKIELTQKIARSLQERMTFREIDNYLGEFNIDLSDAPWGNSKYEYVSSALAGKPTTLILEIADELQVVPPESVEHQETSFRFWRLGYFRVFLSHTSKNKDKAARLGRALLDRGCIAFVAHEDIKPSLEWRQEILRALRSTDALVAILTDDFHASEWTDQEIGIALGHSKLVVPVMSGANPYGFMEQIQGKKALGLKTGEVAESIIEAISASPTFGRKYADTIIGLALGSRTSDELARWIGQMRELESFDLAALRNLRDELSNDLGAVDHLPFALDEFNELFVVKGIDRVVRPKTQSSDFDDEIPF